MAPGVRGSRPPLRPGCAPPRATGGRGDVVTSPAWPRPPYKKPRGARPRTSGGGDMELLRTIAVPPAGAKGGEQPGRAGGDPKRRRPSPAEDPEPPAAPQPRHHAGAEVSRVVVDPTTGRRYCRGRVLGKGGFAKCYEMTDLTNNKVYAAKIIPHSRVAKPHQREKVRAVGALAGPRVGAACRGGGAEPVPPADRQGDRAAPAPAPQARRPVPPPLRGPGEHLHPARILQPAVHGSHPESEEGADGARSPILPPADRVGAEVPSRAGNPAPGPQTRTICGTPNYLSPEVLNKQGHGCESDIWALGCVMYTMLLGRPPFETTNLKETYRCIREARYTMPSSLLAPAKHLIASMLSKNPEDRPRLDDIIRHEFFVQGFTPDRLSSSCCHTVPDFHLSSPAKNFFRKAAAALFGGKKDKARYIDTHNRASKEDEDIYKLRNDLKKTSITQQPSKHRTDEELQPPPATVAGSGTAVVENRQQVGDVIRMIVRGTLGSCSSSSECLEDSTMGSVADTVARVLRGCLENMPEADCIPREQLSTSFQWVTKWVDYSNKYGFGYQLSDHTVGVLFNNGAHMSLLPDKRTVHYYAELGQCSVFTATAAPEQFISQVTVLKYFSHYMEENLMDSLQSPLCQSLQGGDLPSVTDTRRPRLYLLQWLKSDKALMMLFNDGTFQVNFYHDHTKLIVCSQGGEHLLTYINEDRLSATFRLATLLASGCAPALKQRMEYALNMLLQRCT
ncbi:serine/threonine-protein kinase PLK2 isoform X2 [Myotis daubentonii]|uniref:serine/threonine-protein kinase PLK2 isoform X2 n=1 Tax=Myotis daubentonii TaxID=98922 RepID=UPI002873ECFF|nr:serine/threonine-protein kinase PLK2 isoform X2 [Myotis daubentonii]